MGTCTFVHAADLHLDAPFRGITQELLSGAETSSALAGALAKATFVAFERLVQTCLDVQADFLILSGDVYNAAESSLKAHFALHDGFTRLAQAGIPVFWAHGNHDPLPPASKKLPWPSNVTIFGNTVSVHPVMVNNEVKAIVHGISHTSTHEERNLATFFMRQEQVNQEGSIPQIGVLHCALQGSKGSHIGYAPCTGADLLAAQLDYFALGHVHSCLVFAPQEAGSVYTAHNFSAPRSKVDACQELPVSAGNAATPLYAYSGSTQGLHVNESGGHGCLVVSIQGANRSVRFVPLAPVEWDTLTCNLEALPLDDEESIVSLEEALLAQLALYSPDANNDTRQYGWQPDARVVRLVLEGRSSINHQLRKEETLHDLQEHLALQLSGSGVWLRDIIVQTKPMLDLTNLEDREDFMGELARLCTELTADADLLKGAATEAFGQMQKSLRIRNKVKALSSTELEQLLEEAKLMCLDLLETE